MSEESENAALSQIKDTYTSATASKAALEGKMKTLGDRLSAFATVLQNPGKYAYSVDESDSVSVGQPSSEVRRPVARVTPSDFDWKDLCETLRGYIRAGDDKKRSAALLKDMGLPVPE